MYVGLQNNRSVVYQTYIKKNNLELHDDYFGIFSNVAEDYFYSRSRNEYFTADDEYGPGKGIYFYQSFKLDKEYDLFERQVYPLTGVL